LKQYVYKASEIGLAEWPSGTLRLNGIDVTDNPGEADLFVVPGALYPHFVNPGDLYKLPDFKNNEAKHVFMDVSDYEPVYKQSSLFIRCNTRTWYLDKDPNTISFAWPVKDFGDCVDVSEDGFKYDVSFQGWRSSNARAYSVDSCKANPHLKCDIAEYPNFAGYLTSQGHSTYDPAEWDRRWNAHRRSIKESRLVLAPESIPGVFPYRFFEAMSAGRVPVLIGKDFVFPFAHRIPYADFIIHIDLTNAQSAGQRLADFLQNHSDHDIIERGKEARRYWLKYLNSDNWPDTMALAIKDKLGC
jgi:hypothetical protein